MFRELFEDAVYADALGNRVDEVLVAPVRGNERYRAVSDDQQDRLDVRSKEQSHQEPSWKAGQPGRSE